MQILMSILLVIFITLLVIGISFFLTNRFAFYFSLKNKKLLFAIGLWFITLVSAGAFGLVHNSKLVPIIIHWITSIALGFYLYLIICTLLIELVRKIINFPKKLAGLAALITPIFIVLYGIYNAYQLVITERIIAIDNLTKPIKAVHITDTHIGQFRAKKDLQKVVNEINKINPDIVFHTGDLLDSRIHLHKNILDPLLDIKAPIFFVHGNHDQDTGMLEIGYELRKLKVRYLQNQIEEWQGIQIIGLDYMKADENAYYAHSNRKKRATVKRILEQMDIDNTKPAILLHHGPNGTKYAQAKGVDLYLAGHTHGGQVFPFNFLNKYFFEFNAGLYDLEGMKINIPYGVGTFGPPMRIGTISEFVVLNLIPAK